MPGEGVCGSAEALPFADESFDVVAAFDVVEHCEDDALAVSELARVLAPGGRMLLSVPAYQWAWSDHDVRAGHHRRYTRSRLERLVEGAGLSVARSTYAFGAVFPLFVAERARRRMQVRCGQGGREQAAERVATHGQGPDGAVQRRPPAAPETRPAVRLVDLPRSRQALGALRPSWFPAKCAEVSPQRYSGRGSGGGGRAHSSSGSYPAALRSSASFSSPSDRDAYQNQSGALPT